MKINFLFGTLLTLLLVLPEIAYGEPEQPVTRIQRMVIEEAVRQAFSPTVALAVAKVESDFQPHAVSAKGAIGVMQIMPATATGEFSVDPDRLTDPYTNIELGIRFLVQLQARYGDLGLALSHYNGGTLEKVSRQRLRVKPATRKYVRRVQRQARAYGNSPSVKQAIQQEQLAQWRQLDQRNAGFHPARASYADVIDWSAAERRKRVAALRSRHAENTEPGLNRGESHTERVRRVRGWERVYQQPIP